MKKTGTKTLLDGKGVERVLSRLTHEIIEKNKGAGQIVLVGIASGGIPLSEVIRRKIQVIEGLDVPTGFVDITLYRDDLARAGYQARMKRTEVPFSIDDKRVILVDDVLYTGRTIRAAMDALVDFGRPRNIQLAVLIDRGHRELPIRADFVGRNVPTSRSETVVVRVEGAPEEWTVLLKEDPPGKGK
ncbi:MAG: bifunctional pyr operon transcriptional regulator/uracil phosphoribosyltransferase [Deltaproteobacteria bacterium CG2_30_66_27]|nr:MAG: bifunctional pyr operon transcriptional regulator/uracil phosphoribosyltransferase [Deltaproteobacteria bacterium CG2_30_66_27]PJB30946.1 MAG: bifunctional pyr operon transcriptional regulator/uracil phosphoribosyltransferase PyrR [Deltaproteobacteria bacterium CG_4_9_14_3_um_filter_65_9]